MLDASYFEVFGGYPRKWFKIIYVILITTKILTRIKDGQNSTAIVPLNKYGYDQSIY